MGFGTGTAHGYTGVGVAGQILTSAAAGTPAWVTVLPIANGGTNSTAVPTAGTVMFGNGTAQAYTAVGVAGQILTSAAAGTPAWVTLTPIANGGTNSAATATAGGIGYGTGTAHAYTAAGVAGQLVTSAGAGVPAFITLVPIANGGTNSAAVATAGGAVYGTGTAHAITAAGTSGQFLKSAGAAAPVWGTISTIGYTVATLPAGTVGDRAHVTNALAPAFGAAVVGGGAVVIPVFRNATVWVVG